jgi:hypothetical protein
VHHDTGAKHRGDLFHSARSDTPSADATMIGQEIGSAATPMPIETIDSALLH